MSEKHEDFPDFHAGPPLGQELGVMFGFMGFCILMVGVYWFVWQAAQRRASRKEAARRDALSARGINEKGVDQHGNQVHGLREDMGYNSSNPSRSPRPDEGLGIGTGAGTGSGIGRVSPQFRNGGGDEIWRD
ncbi:hypothetical protein FQN54_003224 [Arachnomyces sp. PD_36]|nr:hypothetical protein FQN54_003224 [Arachnomyces sp. PD_36]